MKCNKTYKIAPIAKFRYVVRSSLIFSLLSKLFCVMAAILSSIIVDGVALLWRSVEQRSGEGVVLSASSPPSEEEISN